MNSKELALLVIAAICVSVFLSVVAYNNYVILDVTITKAEMKVENKIGFDVNNSFFKFGILSPGSCAKRLIYITHTFDFPVRVEISSHGQMKGWINPQENDFIIQPKERKGVHVSGCAPQGIPYGNYTGFVRTEYRRAI